MSILLKNNYSFGVGVGVVTFMMQCMKYKVKPVFSVTEGEGVSIKLQIWVNTFLDSPLFHFEPNLTSTHCVIQEWVIGPSIFKGWEPMA